MAACAPAAETPLPIAHQMDVGGVQLLDRNQRIDFGRTAGSSISAMTKLKGSEPIEGSCADLRRAVWSDGTALFFAKNRFMEWSFRGWESGESAVGRTCSSV